MDKKIETDVTNVAEQEVITGKQITPGWSDEEWAQRAVESFPATLRKLEQTLKSAKAKEITQGIIGGIDLPKGGEPVKWCNPDGSIKPEFKKTVEIFRLTQALVNSRTIIAQSEWLRIAKPKIVEEMVEKLEKMKKGENNE